MTTKKRTAEEEAKRAKTLVNVKFIEKTIEIEQKEGEVKKVKDQHRKPDGGFYKAGDEALVTKGYAKWLADHGYIDKKKTR